MLYTRGSVFDRFYRQGTTLPRGGIKLPSGGTRLPQKGDKLPGSYEQLISNARPEYKAILRAFIEGSVKSKTAPATPQLTNAQETALLTSPPVRPPPGYMTRTNNVASTKTGPAGANTTAKPKSTNALESLLAPPPRPVTGKKEKLSPLPVVALRPSTTKSNVSTPQMPPGAAARAPFSTPNSVNLQGTRRRLAMGSRQSADTSSTKQSADAASTPTDPPLARLTPERAADPEFAPTNATTTTKSVFGVRTPASEGASTRRWKHITKIVNGEFTVVRKSLAEFKRDKIPGITEAMINKAWETKGNKMVVGGVNYYVLDRKQVAKYRKAEGIASARKSARKSAKI